MAMCSLIFPSDSAPSLKEEEETYKVGGLADGPSSDTVGSASPAEPSQDEKRYCIVQMTRAVFGGWEKGGDGRGGERLFRAPG